MATTNDITGDSIQTKTVSNAYRDNFDAIFRKKSPQEKDDAKAEDEAFDEIQNKLNSK